MWYFHLTIDHAHETCMDLFRHLQMKETEDQHGIITEVETDSPKVSTSHTFFLEYEYDSDGNGDVLFKINDPSYSVLTRGHRASKFSPRMSSNPKVMKTKDSSQPTKGYLKYMESTSLNKTFVNPSSSTSFDIG